MILKVSKRPRDTEEPVANQEISMSIVVPCYKAERYLPTCLDSLMGQTLGSIEVICVNDGSPDHSLDILRDYQSRYGDKIVVVDKENEGVWLARLEGVRRARGRYIGFVDSDDYVEPTYAEELYTEAVLRDADMVVAGFERTDLDTGRVLSRELCTPRAPFTIEGNEGRVVEINTALWNKCFRAELLKGMRALEHPIEVLEDVMFHLLAYLDSSATIAFVPRPLIHYMVHGDSAINSMRDDQVSSVLAAFMEVRDAYLERRPAMLEALDTVAFLHLGVSLVFRMSCDPGRDLRPLIRQITAFLDEGFPTWRRSPYVSLHYSLSHGPSYQRLMVARLAYRAHLIRPLLACYRLVISRLHVDIKW